MRHNSAPTSGISYLKSDALPNDLSSAPMCQVVISDGLNVIDIQSDGYADCITVYNEMLAMVWRTNLIYYSVSSPENRLDQLKSRLDSYQLSDALESMVDNLRGFMECFKSGIYTISIASHNLDHFEMVHDASPLSPQYSDSDEGGFTYCNYTDKYSLIFSKPYADISEDLVNQYKQEILAGKRPIVIGFGVLYTDSADSEDLPVKDLDVFIIDGHHKLLAYINCS